MATLLGLGGSSVLSWYFGQVGDLSRTFGTFGAVGVLMLWLLLTGLVVLLGAELNAELEHQVEADSTVPPEQPLGRGELWWRTVPEERKTTATPDLLGLWGRSS